MNLQQIDAHDIILWTIILVILFSQYRFFILAKRKAHLMAKILSPGFFIIEQSKVTGFSKSSQTYLEAEEEEEDSYAYIEGEEDDEDNDYRN